MTRAATALAWALLPFVAGLPASEPVRAAELRLSIRSDPKTFHPLLVDEESGEMVRYLTAGVLVRMNRATQKLEPELAVSWKVTDAGRRITFRLRQDVRFSDGTPFTSNDVAATVRKMMAPETHSPIGDSFRAADGAPVVSTSKAGEVSILFPTTIAGVESLFDQVGIIPNRAAQDGKVVLGPFYVAEHRPGSYLLLKRNPYYWRRDEAGKPLPYLDAVRLDIQSNRDTEMLRFRRGELHLMTSLDPIAFEQLKADAPARTVDAGPSFDTEFLWFNQVQRAPIEDHKKRWFQSRAFRRAISGAINRGDLARLVYRGHASPAAGPFSESNKLWFNQKLRPHAYAPGESIKELEKAGFRTKSGALFDPTGAPVEFSLITNAGNKARARMAALIQQDLSKIGVRLNIVTLDFPALIERITKTFNYEACLLGFVNIDMDPNSQMNVWLSSAANHPWNPRQKRPETAWEAEIDKLMQLQASTSVFEKRRSSFNRVQEIISEQVPVVYLVTKNALMAVDPKLRNVSPSPMAPQLLWNAHQLRFAESSAERR